MAADTPALAPPGTDQLTIATPREMTSIAATCYEVADVPSGIEVSFGYFGVLPLKACTLFSVTLLPIGAITSVLINRESFTNILAGYANRERPPSLLAELAKHKAEPAMHYALLANQVTFAVSPFSGSIAFSMLAATRVVNNPPGEVLKADAVIQVNLEPSVFAHLYHDLLAASDRLRLRVSSDFHYLADALPDLSDAP